MPAVCEDALMQADRFLRCRRIVGAMIVRYKVGAENRLPIVGACAGSLILQSRGCAGMPRPSGRGFRRI